MKKINLIRSLSVLALIILSNQASANIFKCEKSNGKVYYHDKPCPVLDKETEIRAEKDVENGYVPPKFVKEEKEKARRSESSQAKSVIDVSKKNEKKSKEEKVGNSSSIESNSSGTVSMGMLPVSVMTAEENKIALALGDKDDPKNEALPVLTQVEKAKYLKITPALSK